MFMILLALAWSVPMPVQGRIDHMAVDVEHQRLYVAALGNGTLEVVDLRARKVVQSVGGMKEPQGVAYVPGSGKVFVAAGGEGRCYVFSGDPLRRTSVFEVGEDPDNIRYDAGRKRLYIGYGGGALAIFDPVTLQRLGDIKLPGHPESFQLEENGSRIFVNIPDARSIAVVDREKQVVLSSWPLRELRANFPMALVESDHRILVATRKPARLVTLDSSSGKIVGQVDCAGDADDMYFDAGKNLAYVSCGNGVIDVFARRDSDHYEEAGRIPTAAGARTSLWVQAWNQLLLAVPAKAGQAASIRVYRQD